MTALLLFVVMLAWTAILLLLPRVAAALGLGGMTFASMCCAAHDAVPEAVMLLASGIAFFFMLYTSPGLPRPGSQPAAPAANPPAPRPGER